MTTIDLFQGRQATFEQILHGGVRLMFIDGWMPRAEADAAFAELRSSVAWRQETIRIFGRTTPIPRLTAWFSDKPYRYSGILHDSAPWHPVVQSIREALQRDFGDFDACLANLYLDGKANVGWHSDDEAAIEPDSTIVSVSLGAPRRFLLRDKIKSSGVKPIEVHLGDGALLMMGAGCQRLYEHRVPRESGDEPRISLTFRRMR